MDKKTLIKNIWNEIVEDSGWNRLQFTIFIIIVGTVGRYGSKELFITMIISVTVLLIVGSIIFGIITTKNKQNL